MYTCTANGRISSSTVGNTMYIKHLMTSMYMYIYQTNSSVGNSLVIYLTKRNIQFYMKFILYLNSCILISSWRRNFNVYYKAHTWFTESKASDSVSM